MMEVRFFQGAPNTMCFIYYISILKYKERGLNEFSKGFLNVKNSTRNLTDKEFENLLPEIAETWEPAFFLRSVIGNTTDFDSVVLRSSRSGEAS